MVSNEMKLLTPLLVVTLLSSGSLATSPSPKPENEPEPRTGVLRLRGLEYVIRADHEGGTFLIDLVPIAGNRLIRPYTDWSRPRRDINYDFLVIGAEIIGASSGRFDFLGLREVKTKNPGTGAVRITLDDTFVEYEVKFFPLQGPIVRVVDAATSGAQLDVQIPWPTTARFGGRLEDSLAAVNLERCRADLDVDPNESLEQYAQVSALPRPAPERPSSEENSLKGSWAISATGNLILHVRRKGERKVIVVDDFRETLKSSTAHALICDYKDGETVQQKSTRELTIAWLPEAELEIRSEELVVHATPEWLIQGRVWDWAFQRQASRSAP